MVARVIIRLIGGAVSWSSTEILKPIQEINQVSVIIRGVSQKTLHSWETKLYALRTRKLLIS